MSITSVFFSLNTRVLRDLGFKGDKCSLSNLHEKKIHWTDARVLLILFKVGSFCLGKKVRN